MIFIVFGLLGLIASSQVNLKPETTALANTAASENPNYPKALYPNNDCAVSNCYNGRCISPSVCLCDPYYANFPEDSVQSQGVACNYKRKSWVLVFLVELFIGNGIGHMIAGNVTYGVLKLLCGLTGCVSKIIMALCSKESGEKVAAFGCCICCMLCVYCIWCITDICIFLFGVYRDGNGVTVF